MWRHRNSPTTGGGLGILLREDIIYREKKLLLCKKGLLEIPAIETKLQERTNKWMEIVNIYNPNNNIKKEELKHYIQQLGASFIICGDLNAHSPILDDKYHKYANVTGKTLESILIEKDVALINPKKFITFVDKRTGKLSCLDIYLTSSDISLQCTL